MKTASPPARRSQRIRNLLEHLVGPVGSLCFHSLLVIAAIHFMAFRPAEPVTDIQVRVATPMTTDFDPVPPPPPDPDRSDPNGLVTERPAEGESSPVDDPGASSWAPVEIPGIDADSAFSPLVIASLNIGRSASERERALDRNGGVGETERSVSKALEWLRRNQALEGCWGAANPIGVTGLGLLTFLAHGETTDSERYGETVQKALRYLLGQQLETGGFGNPATQAGVYSHAIATYAVAEAYGLSRIPALKGAMDRAVDVILAGQQPGGGWDYAYAKAARTDTSVTGWQVQALKAARLAGSDAEGIPAALERAANSLKSMQDRQTGQFGYTQPGRGNPPITAVGVLCLQLLGHAGEKEVDKGLQFMRGWDLRWQEPGFPNALYGWYYITQAKFHAGGADWRDWNRDLVRELPARQQEDGRWEFAGEEHGANCGPAYATALAALSLQVYYRFLPTYRPASLMAEPRESARDISIEII